MNITFDLLVHQGDILLSANKFDEAITLYLKAKNLKPQSSVPSAKIEEARKWQQELANLNSQQSQISVKFDAQIQQGDHLLAYNLFDEAISSYERAMTLKPGDKTAYTRIKEANRRKQEFMDSEPDVETIEIVEETCITEESEFSHIITTIESQSFSSDKKEMAKKQVSKNCLSMEQLRKVVPLFSMDDDKLEILKFTYDYAEYPEKMYLLRDLLTFSSSKKEFDDFLIDKE